jgi:DNA polymerase eta
MMASKNLPRPVTRSSEGPHWLRILAAELALRLNELRAADPSVWPKTIVLHARHRMTIMSRPFLRSDLILCKLGYDWSRSKQTSFPFARNVTVDTIVGFADRLWQDLVGAGNKQDGTLPYSVTSIALGFTGVEPGETGQRTIEGFFRSGTGTKPLSSGPHGNTYDSARAHHGKRGREAEEGVGPSSDQPEISQIDRDDTTGFMCPRCHQRFEVELGDDGAGNLEQRRAEALARLRMEHGDFHVAVELSKMPDGGDGDTRRLRVVEKERKRKRSAGTMQSVEGIAKFLVKR